ncbi:MAG: family 78 glycoside hydrolase catalytic domain, partial [Verrucomicrobiota bacterium JB024]|nr:family 78 glycoside hydrolase catalytic domain [Verrucomicrobiota bacterium JB024]
MPALLAEIRNADGETVLATSEEWEAEHSPAWEAQTYSFRMNWFDPWQEWLDARRLPADWTTSLEPRFAKAVKVREFADRRLYRRSIPQLERRTVEAESIVRCEELTALENRVRTEDLSIALSMPGAPLRRTRIERPKALLAGGVSGVTVLEGAQPGQAAYDPALVLDFGRQVKGCLELEVEGPSGATLDVGFAEQLIDGWFNNSL